MQSPHPHPDSQRPIPPCPATAIINAYVQRQAAQREEPHSVAIANAAHRLQHLPAALAPRLVGLDADQIRAELDRLLLPVADRLARAANHTPQPRARRVPASAPQQES